MPSLDPTFAALPLRELAEAALAKARELGVDHADLRSERIREQSIRLRDAELDGVNESVDSGLAVRVVHRGTWPEPRIFREIQAGGNIADDEMEHVFNLGIGMAAVISEGEEERVVAALDANGVAAWEIGEIVEGHGRVAVVHEEPA